MRLLKKTAATNISPLSIGCGSSYEFVYRLLLVKPGPVDRTRLALADKSLIIDAISFRNADGCNTPYVEGGELERSGVVCIVNVLLDGMIWCPFFMFSTKLSQRT